MFASPVRAQISMALPLALPFPDVNVVYRKRDRDYGDEGDACLQNESQKPNLPKRVCKDSNPGLADLDVQDAEAFEEELVSNVMKSLEREIRSHSEQNEICGSVCSTDACGINIEYLLEAADDELGIPPSPNTAELLQQFDMFDNLFESCYASEEEAEELLRLCLYAEDKVDEEIPNGEDSHGLKELCEAPNV